MSDDVDGFMVVGIGCVVVRFGCVVVEEVFVVGEDGSLGFGQRQTTRVTFFTSDHPLTLARADTKVPDVKFENFYQKNS
jgi:hypothetical protein